MGSPEMEWMGGQGWQGKGWQGSRRFFSWGDGTRRWCSQCLLVSQSSGFGPLNSQAPVDSYFRWTGCRVQSVSDLLIFLGRLRMHCFRISHRDRQVNERVGDCSVNTTGAVSAFMTQPASMLMS